LKNSSSFFVFDLFLKNINNDSDEENSDADSEIDNADEESQASLSTTESSTIFIKRFSKDFFY